MDSKVKLDGDLNGFSVRNPEKLSIEEYIKEWYELAEKKATKKEIESSNTLLELPKPYIVAGGRFQEMYYWDSFFTCLGLEILGKRDKIENILDNMAYEIKKYGFVPNANRSYYLGRSQPPFFLPLLKQFYLPSMWKSEWFEALGVEEEWWNSNRSITLAGYKFFHYGDNLTGPRPESEKEDIQTAAGDEVIYQNLRAGAESGWDFSSRWFDETNQLKSIRTFDILPVDLNSFLINPESDENYIATYNYLFWNDDLGIYTDYNYKTKMQTGKISLAMFLPLWQGFASEEQAAKVAKFAEKNLLKRGGLVTTNVESGEQWDSPNGWAPLQWIAVKGLEKYGFNQLANKIKKLWINTCKITYKNTHKMLEKYNVINPELMPEDGEYTVQDGFGWTNGVYLDFIHSV